MNANGLQKIAAALAPSANEVLIRDDNPRGAGTTDVVLLGATEEHRELVSEVLGGEAAGFTVYRDPPPYGLDALRRLAADTGDAA